MKRAKYSIKNLIKKGLATLLSVCLIVSGVQTPVYAAEASIPTESTATVSGLVNKKVVLDLLSDDLREAALTAIRENRLFEAGDYLGATSDSAKAIKEYEAFFNRNPGLYVVEVPESVKNILSGEAESELRIFVQKDEKKSKVDLEEENGDDESVLTRDVNFRYGTEDDIILYEPSSQIDTLVNGGEDAYYRDPEQDTADNSDYQLTGKEKITFMFVNASDDSVRYTLKVDGVKYDSVEICGRTAALKHVLAEAGIKKTEETTAAAVETTAAQAANTLTEIPQTGENLIPEGMADPSEMIGQMELTDNEIDNTAIENPVTAEQDAENNNEGYIAVDTDTSQQQLTEENTAELTNNDTAELTNDNAAELTDNDTAGINDQQEANVENVDEAPAQNEDSEGASIVDQIAEAVENAGDLVLGRMTVYAAEIIGEGYIFEDEQKGPETEDREKSEDIAAEAGDTEGNDNEAAEKQNVEADLADNSGTDEGQNNGQEYGQQGGQEIGQQGDGLGTEALAGQNEGSGTEIAGQNEGGSEVSIVNISTEGNQEEGVQTDITSTEISTGDAPADIEGTIPEGQTDITGMMPESETTAAVDIQKPVASPSEVEETKGEYDAFAKALIEEVKKAVLEDKDAAKEQLKVAKIVQYSIGSLGKMHYSTEIDGYTVEVFAPQDAFGGFKPKLEVKRLYKPEEAEGNGDAPTDAQIAELKANGIYDNSLLLDICFKNDVDDEVEPNGNVNVRMTLNDEELLKKVDASSLEVHHIKDNNSTLKTEKVAAKDEVKILDGNDIQISDSDLEANAEAIAAGEEAEVEVASAVAEFEIESFSLFAITWKTNNYQTTEAEIKVHYYEEYTENGETKYREILLNTSKDAEGDNIYDAHNEFGVILELSDVTSGNVKLAEWQGGVTGYDYVEARLDSVNGTKVVTDVARNDSTKKIIFKDTNGNEVEAAGATTETTTTTVDNSGWVKDNQNGTYNEDHELLELYYYSKNGHPHHHENDPKGYYGDNDSDFKRFTGSEGKSTVYYKTGSTYKKKEKIYTLFEKYEGDRYRYVTDIQEVSTTTTTPAEKHVYLIYHKHSYPIGGDGEALNADDYPITREKTLTPNDDGTYKLTLSVTGKKDNSELRKPVNVVFVYDTSNSMKYDKNGNSTNVVANQRITIAKEASTAMVDELMKWNKDEDENFTGDTVQMAFITFNRTASIAELNNTTGESSHITNDPEVVKAKIENATVAQYTNWEDALIKANSIDFGDDDPVHIIFVSDGAPTARYSRNGYTADGGSEGQWGTNQQFTTESKQKCHEAAERAAHDIKAANKTLYTIGAFPVKHDNGIDELEQLQDLLFDEDKSNYYSATDKESLEEAFDDICDKISTSVGYTEVHVTDGITDLTASTDVKGEVKDYTYEILDKSGNKVTDSNVLNALNGSAGYDSDKGAVVWNFPTYITVDGEQKIFVLEDGYKYLVSFTVWPEQETYDTLAELENKYGANPTDEAFEYDEVEKIWKYKEDPNYFHDGTVYRYKTNTSATVNYKIIKTSDDAGDQIYGPSRDLTIPMSKDSIKGMSLASSTIRVDKVWQLNNKNQQTLIDKTSEIKLTLQRREVGSTVFEDFIEGITISKPSTDPDPEAITITWPGGSKYIAPGILVSKAKGDSYGFDKLWLQEKDKEYSKQAIHLIGNEYYMLETGHDYRFNETSGNAAFSLKEEIYHPMLVDGKLTNVAFTYGEDGVITGVSHITEVGGLTVLTATNVIDTDELKVSKMYTGSMAEPHSTEFKLYLYEVKDGTTTLANYEEDYIKGLKTEAHDNADLDISKQADGGFKFTIDMMSNADMSVINIDAYDDVTIVLPAGVSYRVEEFNPGSGYVTYCDTKEIALTGLTNAIKKSETETNELSEVHTIYFVNKKDAITPTGYAGNAYPFAVLALAGFAAMFFLACDFEKKRLFED